MNKHKNERRQKDCLKEVKCKRCGGESIYKCFIYMNGKEMHWMECNLCGFSVGSKDAGFCDEADAELYWKKINKRD